MLGYRRVTRRSAALVAVAVAAIVAGGPLASGGERASAAITITPLVSSPVAQTTVVPVRGSDGRYYVVYELLVTNSTSKPASLHSVQVLNAASGKVVGRIGGKDLLGGALLGADRSPVENTKIGASESRVLYLNPGFASRRAVPARLVQRFDVSGVEPVTGKVERTRYRSAPTVVSKRQAPSLVPPLEGAGWLASNACCGTTSHVTAMYGIGGRLQAAERFAADWIQISADGRVYHGDPQVLSNWVGYGAPVRAAGGGVVTSTHNGRPEQTPQTKPASLPIPQLPGNEVEIRMKNGLTAVYAHLVKGSVAVRVGDRVKPGQLLGLVGNSGGTLAPHLHFHIVEGPSGIASDGYPNTFTSFGQTGQIDLAQLLNLVTEAGAVPSSQLTNPVAHRNELPLDGTINVFPTR